MEKESKGYSISLGAVAITPETVANTPDTTLNAENGYVNFGVDNKLHYFLADAIQHSPTHSAIIDFKASVIYGNGINYDNYDSVLPKEYLEKAIKKAATDIPVFETLSWLVTTNIEGQIIRVTGLPNEGARVSDLDPATGEPLGFYFSYNWANGMNILEFKPFDVATKQVGQFILQKRIVRPNQYYYTIPSYYSANRWITLENTIAVFHSENINNGFFPTVIMEFFGDEPNENDKLLLEQKVQQKFQGVKGKKVFPIFNEEGNTPTKITTFNPPDLPNYFEKLMSEISAKIMTSHRIPAILVGIKEVGKTGLGSNSEEIQASYKLYESTSIIPYRNLINEAVSDIMKYNESDFVIDWNEFKPSFGEIDTVKGSRNDLITKE